MLYSMVLIGLALIMDHHSSRQAVDEDNGQTPEENIEQLVSRVTAMLAPVLLPMIDVVGSLSLENLQED